MSRLDGPAGQPVFDPSSHGISTKEYIVAGSGLPPGGEPGQWLVKLSDADYDVGWAWLCDAPEEEGPIPDIGPLWLLRQHYVQALIPVSIPEDGVVILAGAAGTPWGSGFAINNGRGAVGWFTMPAGSYYLSIGATGAPAAGVTLPHTTEWAETWGYGGPGNYFGAAGSPDPYSGYVGGGRTEIRTSTSRASAILIAPGGGGVGRNTGAAEPGDGGWVNGHDYPRVSVNDGGGATQTAPGLGGEKTGSSTWSYGYHGDGTGRGDGNAEIQSIEVITTPGVGSGGQAGAGYYDFGTGYAGGGGGGGKHGGGGGSGGYDLEGRAGGGGSGETSGAKTIVDLADGGTAGPGFAIVEAQLPVSALAQSISQQPGLVSYLPCEEPYLGKIGATDIVANVPFVDWKVWHALTEPTTAQAVQSPATVDHVTLDGRPAYTVSTVGLSGLSQPCCHPSMLPDGWDPPEFLGPSGSGWACEWSGKVVSGTTAIYGPGTTDGQYPTVNPGYDWLWYVYIDSATLRFRLNRIDGSAYWNIDIPLDTIDLPASGWVRCGISYSAAADTFFAYRKTEAGALSTGSKTRAEVGGYSTGWWRTSPNNRYGALSCMTASNDMTLSADVMVFAQHRSVDAFDATAEQLGFITPPAETTPVAVATFTLPDSTAGRGLWIDQANDIAWVVGEAPNRLVAIDISDPTSPSQISNTALAFVPSRLVKVGNYLYCTGDTSDSIWSIDVSTPSSPGTPYQNYSFPFFNDLRSIATDGTYLYANGYRITINSPTSLSPADAVATQGTIDAHYYDPATGQLWWVTGASDSTVLVDVDGTHVGLGYLTDGVNTPSARGVVASGAFAFVGQDSGFDLTAIDFTTPGSPSIADSIVGDNLSGADGRALAINPAANRLYASGPTIGQFVSVDISDPSNLSIVYAVPVAALSQARQALYLNGYVFIVTGDPATSSYFVVMDV